MALKGKRRTNIFDLVARKVESFDGDVFSEFLTDQERGRAVDAAVPDNKAFERDGTGPDALCEHHGGFLVDFVLGEVEFSDDVVLFDGFEDLRFDCDDDFINRMDKTKKRKKERKRERKRRGWRGGVKKQTAFVALDPRPFRSSSMTQMEEDPVLRILANDVPHEAPRLLPDINNLLWREGQ